MLAWLLVLWGTDHFNYIVAEFTLYGKFIHPPPLPKENKFDSLMIGVKWHL